MMILSVLLIVVTLHAAQSLRLTDIDNEVVPAVSDRFQRPKVWLKMKQMPPPVVRKRVGSHVELVCEAFGAPPPTIQWYKNNIRVTENEVLLSNSITKDPALAIVGSRLVINYVLPRHQDIYRCVATSGANEVSGVTKLVVPDSAGREMNITQLINAKILGAFHYPRVTFWASAYMDVIGNDIILPCNFVGNPKPSVIWIDPEGKFVDSDERFTIFPDGALRIKSIVWDHMGNWRCVVENTLGEDAVDTFLYPLDEPKN